MDILKDKNYKKIVKDIIRNNNFKKTYEIEHHGIRRMEHSIKVSYYSYIIARKLNLDFISTARGGLLHDFYLEGNERSKKRKFCDTFTHPKKALNTSIEYFKLNNIERNIIISHMFPIYLNIPKYKESILVNLVDKFIGSYEMFLEYKNKFVYTLNYRYILLLLIVSNIKEI